MNEKENPIINKIEVDDNTLEPKIVEETLSERVEGDDLTFEEKQELTLTEGDYRLKSSPKYRRVIEQDKLSSKEFKKKAGRQMFLTNFFGVTEQEDETSKRQRIFKRVFTILFAVVMFGVIFYTFYTDFFAPGEDRVTASFSDFLDNISKNWYFLLLAIASLGCCFFFKGFKLSIMCKKMTGKWHLKTCFETGIIGHYYNNVTPLAAGGQPFEIYHLSKNGVHGGTASSLPIVAFFMFQFAFVSLGIFSIVCFTPATNIFNLPSAIIDSTTATVLRPLAIVGVCLGLFMPSIVIIFSLLPRVCAKLVGLVIALGAKLKLVKDAKLLTRKTLKTVVHNSRCIKKFATSPVALISLLIVSFLEVISLCSIAFFTLKFFGFNLKQDVGFVLEWAQIVLVSMVLYSAISFIPTPGNSGAADFSFYWLFGLGLLGGFAFPAMIIWRILSYYMFIIVGIIFISGNKRREQKRLRDLIDDDEQTTTNE